MCSVETDLDRSPRSRIHGDRLIVPQTVQEVCKNTTDAGAEPVTLRAGWRSRKYGLSPTNLRLSANPITSHQVSNQSSNSRLVRSPSEKIRVITELYRLIDIALALDTFMEEPFIQRIFSRAMIVDILELVAVICFVYPNLPNATTPIIPLWKL